MIGLRRKGRARTRFLVAVAALAGPLAAWAPAAAAAPQPPIVPASAATTGAVNAPLLFEPNRGQSNGPARFIAHGSGLTVFLTPVEVALSLRQTTPSTAATARTIGAAGKRGSAPHPPTVSGAVVRMRFDGGNANAEITGEDLRQSTTSYLVGSNPTGWHTGIPNYARLRYHNLYPGIDMVYHGIRGRPEYDFVLAADADPNVIRLSFNGASSLAIDPSGALIENIKGGGRLEQPAPTLYQVSGGLKAPVQGSYRLMSSTEVGFIVGAHDESQPLVIDPVIDYGSYVSSESPSGVTVDSHGDAYIVGDAASNDFPATSGAFQTTYYDAESVMITKFNPQGSGVLYSTFVGGHTSTATVASRPAVDSAGNLYVAGSVTLASDCQQLSCADFPVSAGAFQTAFQAGGDDDFVLKLDASGSRLIYASYLGSSGSGGLDAGPSIAIDSAGDAYVAGTTFSSDFPTTPGVFQPHPGSPFFTTNAFVTKVNPKGSALVYSSYLGGSGADSAGGIAVASDGTAYITGATLSLDFPVTFGAFQTSCAGGSACADAFVTRVNATGTALVYSTYLGGGNAIQNFGTDIGLGIAVDGSGFAYITGYTDSIDFPVTIGAFHTRISGLVDAFVTKMTPDGTNLAYSTYVGGDEQACPGGVGTHIENATGIAVDTSGEAVVTGLECADPTFPVTPDAFQPVEPSPLPRGPFTTDIHSWVTKLNAAGSGLVWSSYLGGGGVDEGTSVAVDPAGNVYLTGSTDSCNFPVTPGAFQTVMAGAVGGGGSGGYLVKVSDGTPQSPAAGSCSQPAAPSGSSPGAADPSFGVHGVVTTQVGTASDAQSVVTQPDGTIVAAGTAVDPKTGLVEFAVTRYLVDGTLDSQFGVHGVAIAPFKGKGAFGEGVALNIDPQTHLPDGKLVVVGQTLDSADLDAFAVARFDSHGRLDRSFGDGGEVATPAASTGGGYLKALLVQPDDKIVAVVYNAIVNEQELFEAVRYNTDGTLDHSFGAGGVAEVAFGIEEADSIAIALQPDGKIVLGGKTTTIVPDAQNTVRESVRFAVARLLPNGALDSSFGGGSGEVETSYDTYVNGIRHEKDATATSIAVQADGRIVAGGFVNEGLGSHFALARYDSDGSIDTTFGSGGRVETDFFGGGSSETALALTLQTDGRIDLVGGSNCNLDVSVIGACAGGVWASDVLAAQYTSSGTLDQTFGNGGWVETSLSRAVDNAAAAALEPDGALVVAGVADEGGFFGPPRFGVVRYLTAGAAAFQAPATLTSPVVATFATPVRSITTANMLLQVAGGSSAIAAALTCADANGNATNCVAGTVSTASLLPTSPLMAGQHYVAVINPAGVRPKMVFVGGSALPNETAQFRAPTSVEESGAGVADQWSRVSATGAYGGSYQTDHVAGATASFNFIGNAVTWYTLTGPNQGIAIVSIDGTPAGTVDLYSPATSHRVPETYGGLTPGAHVITITVTGTKSSSATDALVAVDAFAVGTGSVETTPAVTYKWTSVAAAAASGGAYAGDDLQGALVSFTFRGTGVTWQTVRGPSMGNATLSIDGVAVHTFDDYAASWTYGVDETWPVSDGVHTVTIKVLGTKDSASSGTNIAVDGFSVT